MLLGNSVPNSHTTAVSLTWQSVCMHCWGVSVSKLQTALGLLTLGATGPQVCRAEETRAVSQVPRTRLAPLLNSQTESVWELPEPMCQQSSFAHTTHLFYLLNQIFLVLYLADQLLMSSVSFYKQARHSPQD